MNPENTVPHYQASGRIDWGRFFPRVVLTGVVALTLSTLMYLLLTVGFYLLGVVAFVVAIILAYVVRAAISHGHVRNRSVAMMFGVVAGAVAYLGFYHAGLVHALGISQWYRVDLLPDYIEYRLRNDKSESVPSYSDDSDTRPPTTFDYGMNVFIFLLEAAACVGLPALAGFSRASRPFCERCGKWMNQHLVTFTESAAARIPQLLRDGRPADIVNLPQMSSAPHARNTTMALEYCGREDSDRAEPCPAYLSVRACKSGSLTQAGQFEMAIGRMVITRRRLLPHETAALAPLHAPLSALAGPAPIVAPPVDQPAEMPAELPAEVVDEVAIPPIEHVQLAEYRKGAVANNRVLGKSALWAMAPLGVLCVTVIMLIVGVLTTVIGVTEPATDNIPRWARYALLTVGGVSSPFAIVWFVRNMQSLRDRFLHRRMCELVRSREDRWVDPDDPDAMFVEYVPRANWVKLMLDTAVDFGFVKADHERLEITFEGDCNRFGIPVEAVKRCAVEHVIGPQGNSPHAAVVILAQDNTQRIELPFIAFQPPWRSGRKASEAAAMELASRLAPLFEARQSPTQ
ncbi:MAG: hypothetical protein H6817_03010 [Phycisphaerales bacterium]|nr:hypothetical protein [Phycisphaerales bacterium]